MSSVLFYTVEKSKNKEKTLIHKNVYKVLKTIRSSQFTVTLGPTSKITFMHPPTTGMSGFNCTIAYNGF